MLRTVYLTANQAWAITTDAEGINLIGIGPANQHLFESKEELLRVLRTCGLSLRKNLVVLAEEEG